MENNNSNNKVFVATIILLAVCVIGLSSFIIYDKVIKKEPNKENVINGNNSEKQVNETDDKDNSNQVENSDNIVEFKGKVTGYVTIVTEQGDGLDVPDNEEKKLVFFNITSTDSNDIKAFIKNNQGNSFVNEKGFSIGCLENNSIIRDNNYDNPSGSPYTISKTFTIAGNDATRLLETNVSNKITLEIEKKKFTSGGGASLCYSHLTNISIVE